MSQYNEEEQTMLQIQDTLVSLDLAERFFCCDIESCHGCCCIEGDAGAPIDEEEKRKLEEILPAIRKYLSPEALDIIDKQGVSYIDPEGDLVTSIVNGKNCVFTTIASDGTCLCAIEKAYRQGEIAFTKPVSCHLYPLRITKYPTLTAVNFHRWDICRCAEILGKKENIRLYRFLREPLVRHFGQEWYDELSEACEAYLEQYGQE